MAALCLNLQLVCIIRHLNLDIGDTVKLCIHEECMRSPAWWFPTVYGREYDGKRAFSTAILHGNSNSRWMLSSLFFKLERDFPFIRTFLITFFDSDGILFFFFFFFFFCTKTLWFLRNAAAAYRYMELNPISHTTTC